MGWESSRELQLGLACLANGEGKILRGCLANAEGKTFSSLLRGCLANAEGETFSSLLHGLCRQCRRRDLLVTCLAHGEGETFSYVARVRSCNANASDRLSFLASGYGGLSFLASGYGGFHAKTNPLR